MITTTQQSPQFDFTVISGLANNNKSLLNSASLSKEPQIIPHVEGIFPDFNYTFNFETVKITRSLELNNVIFHLKLSERLIIKTTLSGYWTQQEDPNFYPQKIDIEIEEKEETPDSVFLLTTFWAMLGLSQKVKFSVPNLDFNFEYSSELPLNAITNLLEERQIAHRLMTIEKTLGITLSFPDGPIKRKDIENIEYSYHSIIDRKFEWLSDPGQKVGKSETGKVLRPIFDQTINLGLQKLSVIRYGVLEIESITTPTLPKNTFSPETQKLIDLESKFDSIFMDKYLNSFSNAFEGLTNEQIKAITERPDLDEEAFNF